MSTIEKEVEDEGDGFERVDVRSRIAALNGQNRITNVPKSTAKPSPNINSEEDIKTDPTQNKSDESDPPKLDVKSLTALYGRQSVKDPSSLVSNDSNVIKELKPANDVTQIESSKPPAIPSRPKIQIKNETPPQPPIRPHGSSDSNGPPQLPPRLKEGTASRSSTQTSINSERRSESPLPYVPRRPVTGRQATTPAGRLTDDITEKVPYATRERSARKGMTISSSFGSLETGKIAPSLPPRIQLPKSADAAQNSFSSANISKTSTSPNPRLHAQSSTKASESVAPPPRHVDAIRAKPKVAANLSQNRGKLNTHQQFKQKRARRRDEYGQMVYSLDPDPKDEQRYAQLYELQIALQAQQGGSAKVLEQETIVRLWRRSKLDARFLQKVYDEAKGAIGEGVSQTKFVKAMAAIDRELARRQK
jgi:hypothetical protein